MTLVIVTHETDIAAFAARRLQIRDGRVVADERQAPQRALDVLQSIAA
jgi:ABC-type lipoprotein export system ATPase subunit